MAVHRLVCVLACCDGCGRPLVDQDEGYVAHHSTLAEAAAYATAAEWPTVTDPHGGLSWLCPDCAAARTCLRVGHDWGPWTPARPRPRNGDGTWTCRTRTCWHYGRQDADPPPEAAADYHHHADGRARAAGRGGLRVQACWVTACDDCGDGWTTTDGVAGFEEYGAPHAANPTQAAEFAAAAEWTLTDRAAWCPTCTQAHAHALLTRTGPTRSGGER
jgi:hypothetical protein